MTSPLILDTTNSRPFCELFEMEALEKQAIHILENIYRKEGVGSDFMGWVDWPERLGIDELDHIESIANRLRSISDTVVVIGIGGSYLGAKAVLSALSSSYSKASNSCEVVFAGKDISGLEMDELLSYLRGRKFSIIVISKSGTTTEPALAFRILKEQLKRQHPGSFNERIVAITDSAKGALRSQAAANGWSSFVIPDDIGGRFSVLTPVGLLPIAVSGIDFRALILGAKDAYLHLINSKNNPAVAYATVRTHLYRKGFHIEVMANYEGRLAFLAEWWKQLFGESEGKNRQGIFPASVVFTTDLHSLGQYIQDGPNRLMVTTLKIDDVPGLCTVPHDEDDLDGLNYLSGKLLSEINETAMAATISAHTEGGAPNHIIRIKRLDPYHIGYLLYFFELSCAISANLLGVNPFDQPGVEAYKKKMFELLGKPGH